MKRIGILLAMPLSAVAALVPLAPQDGVEVSLLPYSQRRMMEIGSKHERAAWQKRHKDGEWRKSKDIVFVWQATEGEKGPWKIRLGTTPGLEEGIDFWIDSNDAKAVDGAKPAIYRYEAKRANLDLGKEYWWKVWSGVKCRTWECGSTIGHPCPCGKTPAAGESAVASFRTADAAPRWIAIEGRTHNFRDLGGWRTVDGRRVKTGMVFRGEAFNDNSFNGDVPGRNRLTVEDVGYLTKTLGLKTDLDLRSPREVSTMTESPLGPGAKFIHHSSAHYAGIFTPWGKEVMAANFRVFCDPANYPVFFHCIAGADRTGSLAYMLNGSLGVGKADLERDWESTFYPNIPGLDNATASSPHWQGTWWFDKGLAEYGDENTPLKEKIELYLTDCGVTREEIEAFRKIMLAE